jgi:hypothetical protein
MAATDQKYSTFQRRLTWFVFSLTVLLIALGIYWYGFSVEVHRRFWSDIFDRTSGAMTFRLFLQPIMGFIAALPDGINDARHGHSAFFWTARGDDTVKRGRLNQGLVATARIMLIGLSMDAIYQYRMLDQFYPVEAVVFALVLCVIPYFFWRWLIERAAGAWFARHPHKSAMGSPDE